MKSLRLWSLVAPLALVAISSFSAQAADLTWTNSAATGNWNITDANWTGLVWSNATPDNAIFLNRNETVNLTTPITAGTFTLNNGGRQSGNHNLTLNGGSLGITTLTINGIGLGGNVDNLGESNNQRLTINNASVTASGNATVTRSSLAVQGTSVVNIAGSLTSTSAWNNLILQNTASLTVSGGVDFRVIASNLDLNGGTLTTSSIWGNTYSNGTTRTNFNGTRIVATVDNADFLRMSNDGDGAAHSAAANVAAGGLIFDTNSRAVGITNRLAGVGGVTKLGAGTLTLSGANTYAGGTTINQGTLNVTGDAALGAAPSSATTNITFSGNSTLQAGSATVALQGTRNIAINNGVTATFDTNSNAMFVGGVIGGAGAAGLTKTGAGTLVLGAANTYAGTTTISGGTLQLAGPVTTPTLLNGTFELPVTANFVYTLPTDWTNGQAVIARIGGGFTWNVPTNGSLQAAGIQNMQAVSQDLNFAQAGWYTLSWIANGRNGTQVNPYYLTLDGVNQGSAKTWDNSTNTWKATSAPFYVGSAGLHSLGFRGTATTDLTVFVDNLTFLSPQGSLPSTTAVNITTAGAALDINNNNQTIGSLSGVANSSVLLGSGTLTINPTSGSTNFAGVISGTGALTKSGAGAQNLSGANTYSGRTTISGGTLEIDGSINNSGEIVINRTAGAAVNTNGRLLIDATGTRTLGNTANGTGDVIVGDTGFGYLQHGASSGSTAATSNVGRDLVVGRAIGGVGLVDVNNGTTVNVANQLRIGSGVAVGTVNVNAGSTLNVNGNTTIVDGAPGTLNIAGTYTEDGDLIVGQNATGIVNQTGGSASVNDNLNTTGGLALGANPGSSGTYHLLGGTLHVHGNNTTNDGSPAFLFGSTGIGIQGAGTFNHSAGTFFNDTHLGIDPLGAGGASQYNLSGTGVLNFRDTQANTQALATDNAASTLLVGANGDFNFNGGTLMNVTTIDVNNAPGNVFTQDGGRFVLGVDGVQNQLINPATIRAMTTITGDFVQNDGTLVVDIFGRGTRGAMSGEYQGPPGIDGDPINNFITDNDLLFVMGDATLDGTLEVHLNGVDPLPWGWYDVLVADSITITDGILDLDGGIISTWRIITDPSDPSRQILQVATPEPASVALWCLVAFIGLAAASRLRRTVA